MTDVRSAEVLRTTGNLSVFEGVLLLLGGILLVVAPFASVAAFTQVTGVLLLLGGVIGIIRNAGSGHGEHGGGAGVLGPILAALAGVVLLIDPTLAATFMVTVVGALMLVSGGMQIAAACGMRGREHWMTVLICGILTVLVGGVIFLLPAVALLVFAIFAGVQLFITGIVMIQSGSQFRRISRQV
ncbi:MAG: hypothetical protein CMJ34_03910 [Phycisphaerae bacterium]|nr:hypothetical protein [Phycisphaerae bacterium]